MYLSVLFLVQFFSGCDKIQLYVLGGVFMRILMVCHGNICRSPMAEFIFRDMIKREGLSDVFYVESAAVTTEELGNPVYPPAKKVLAAMGIDCSFKRARQMTKSDYDEFDLLIGMDKSNIVRMHRICGGDPDNKIHMLLDYTDNPHEVADPWYTGNFEVTKRDVIDGCRALIDTLTSKEV